jgi:raffinose/stachyose/melibiose transport system permease protein
MARAAEGALRAAPRPARAAVRPPARRSTGGLGHAGTSRWLPYGLLAAPALVYATFVLYPLVTTLRLSLYEWDGLTTPVFVGLGNYVALANDPSFWAALLHNGVFLVFYTALPIALALLLTVLLTQDGQVRGLAGYRVGLFVPQIIPMVVVGVVWRWMYSPLGGAVNLLLGGLGAAPRPFLGDASTALPAVGLVASWVQYGFALVLFLAGAQSVDRALYDAAAVDGAGTWAKFRYVTLPALRGPVVVAATVSLIAALRVFDLVFVMTRGGPANATTVVAFEIYQRAFLLRQVGGAAAVATVLVLLIVALSRLVLRYQEEPP